MVMKKLHKGKYQLHAGDWLPKRSQTGSLLRSWKRFTPQWHPVYTVQAMVNTRSGPTNYKEHFSIILDVFTNKLPLCQSVDLNIAKIVLQPPLQTTSNSPLYPHTYIGEPHTSRRSCHLQIMATGRHQHRKGQPSEDEQRSWKRERQRERQNQLNNERLLFMNKHTQSWWKT